MEEDPKDAETAAASTTTGAESVAPPVHGRGAAAGDGLLPPPEHPIRLPAFEGPLDLLLYLIRKNEIDIYDIPIVTVTRQYLEVIRTAERDNLEVAGEFFVMAATLMYIKSRMLLPADITPATDAAAEGESDAEHDLDPRWELVQQLIQYKKIKECAAHLDALIVERQGYLPRLVSALPDIPENERLLAPADRIELWNTFNRILQRMADRLAPGEIHGETVTIASRMEDILERLTRERRFAFSTLFTGTKPTVAQLVSTFLACLELARLGKLYIAQGDLFDEIYCDTEPPPPPEQDIEKQFGLTKRQLRSLEKRESAAGEAATGDEEDATGDEETEDLPADVEAAEATEATEAESAVSLVHERDAEDSAAHA
ncbi:MAG: segregation/condensation protein A [Puniceicoccales bacterium]|jgi:segregation and condensation protein A|nr:segregation/condensation protein A [Puniceicoccales bacterium]